MDAPDTHFLRHRLPNGIEIVGEPMAGVESAALGILVGAGARHETPETYGISHFAEQLLFRGTETHDARDISEQFDLLGASYDASAGIEMTVASVHLVGNRLPAAVDLLVDCVRSPVFPDDGVDSVRGLQLQEIGQREDRPAQKAMDQVRRQLFATHPLANDVLGTPETVSALTRETLVAYHGRLYGPGNLVLSVAGKFDWDGLIVRLDQLTAGWASAQPPTAVPPPAPRADTTVIDKQDASQEHLGFAFPAVAAADPMYYAAALMAQVLGGGTNSRLHREVREKRGLAYAAQARFDGLQETGLVRMYVGTSPERAPESVRVVMDELRRLERDGIDEDELQLAKTRIKSQVIMRSESTYARMAANLRSLWMEGHVYTLAELRSRIDAVTQGDVALLARNLRVSETVAAVALGPRTRDELFGATPVASGHLS